MKSVKNNKRLSHTIIIELLCEFVNVVYGNACGKIGLSIILLIIALVCLFSPVVGLDNKPINKHFSFYITGGVLIIISFYLIVRRWKGLKKKSKF
ncbi:hypothetical protein OI18_23325 [Flavihumibacter solisilvae]|uniref:Uncharacterized protein n=1 Tax=Flavihumibacter solisilvae TaxID=1349421 RepID=A0A0C1KRG6_9BACT|nr:hypothetical protein OI18_23325 [Flavihumibacter solisilvae]